MKFTKTTYQWDSSSSIFQEAEQISQWNLQKQNTNYSTFQEGDHWTQFTKTEQSFQLDSSHGPVKYVLASLPSYNPVCHTIAGLGRGRSHGQIAGPMRLHMRTRPRPSPRYFVVRGTLHAETMYTACRILVPLRWRAKFGTPFGPACVYSEKKPGRARAGRGREVGQKPFLVFIISFLKIHWRMSPNLARLFFHCKRGS